MMKNIIPSSSDDDKALSTFQLIAFASSFTRVLTLKECLPEHSRKIYYDWKREGLVPESFGIMKSLSPPNKNKDFRKWDRFHIYEFVWIRLVYHLRKMGLPKEYMQRMAKLFFPEMNAALLHKVTKAIQANSKKLNDTTTELTSNLGKKGATHEIEKTFSTIAESLAVSTFHESVFKGLNDRIPFDFVAGNGEIQMSESSFFSKNDSLIPDARQLVPTTTIPFIHVFHDIVINVDTPHLKDMLSLGAEEIKAVELWKKQTTRDKEYKLNTTNSLDSLSQGERDKNQSNAAFKYSEFFVAFFSRGQFKDIATILNTLNN